MGWDGSGGFDRTHNFSADASAGIGIEASRFDAEFDNFATGLENCLTRDGQVAASADIALQGYKFTGVGAAVSADHFARIDQADGHASHYVAITTAVGWTALSANTDVPFTALADGVKIYVRFDGNGNISETATATLNINNTGAKKVLSVRGSAIHGTGAIPHDGTIQQFVFSSADDAWRLVNSHQAAEIRKAIDLNNKLSFKRVNGASAETISASAYSVSYRLRDGVVQIFVRSDDGNANAAYSASTSVDYLVLSAIPAQIRPNSTRYIAAVVLEGSSAGQRFDTGHVEVRSDGTIRIYDAYQNNSGAWDAAGGGLPMPFFGTYFASADMA